MGQHKNQPENNTAVNDMNDMKTKWKYIRPFERGTPNQRNLIHDVNAESQLWCSIAHVLQSYVILYVSNSKYTQRFEFDAPSVRLYWQANISDLHVAQVRQDQDKAENYSRVCFHVEGHVRTAGDQVNMRILSATCRWKVRNSFCS